MKFSQREIQDLLIAWIAISVAFAIIFAGGMSGIVRSGFLTLLVVSIITGGLGFLLHELMHKLVAQRYRLWAEFRASYGMLAFAIVSALFGFLIAAPGAVWIHGLITKERNGKISAAGPITNIILAVIFLVPLLLIQGTGFWQLLLSAGFRINSLLALFNMIPVMPFDGAKIMAWSKPIYWTITICALLLFIGSFII